MPQQRQRRKCQASAESAMARSIKPPRSKTDQPRARCQHRTGSEPRVLLPSLGSMVPQEPNAAHQKQTRTAATLLGQHGHQTTSVKHRPTSRPVPAPGRRQKPYGSCCCPTWAAWFRRNQTQRCGRGEPEGLAHQNKTAQELPSGA